MRRFMEEWQRREPRLQVAPGDPLMHLQRANVYVHPSFQEGFGYAPMEALARDVPVIVTEDTGMKEHVEPGRNGWVVPTGSVEAIVDRVEAMMSAPSWRGRDGETSGGQLELPGGYDHGSAAAPGPRRPGVHVERARPARLGRPLDEQGR